MKYCFGDIVVVEEILIGVVVKSWIRNNEKIIYEVYVRDFNCIKKYEENEIQRYMVRHKELSEEEIEYQNNAVNPFIAPEEIEKYRELIMGVMLSDKNRY